jgi:hypothetical protein
VLPLPRPILILNPRSDAAFAEFTRLLIEEGVGDSVSLELGLRRRFPKARVSEGRLSGEPVVTMYVYREGVWAPDTPA